MLYCMYGTSLWAIQLTRVLARQLHASLGSTLGVLMESVNDFPESNPPETDKRTPPFLSLHYHTLTCYAAVPTL